MVLASRHMRVQPRDLRQVGAALGNERRRRACRRGRPRSTLERIARRLLFAAIAQSPAKAGAGALSRWQQRQGDRRVVPLLGERPSTSTGAGWRARPTAACKSDVVTTFTDSWPGLRDVNPSLPASPRSVASAAVVAGAAAVPRCRRCARRRAAASARSCTAPGSPPGSGRRWSRSPPIIGAATRFMISAPAPCAHSSGSSAARHRGDGHDLRAAAAARSPRRARRRCPRGCAAGPRARGGRTRRRCRRP